MFGCYILRLAKADAEADREKEGHGPKGLPELCNRGSNGINSPILY